MIENLLYHLEEELKEVKQLGWYLVRWKVLDLIKQKKRELMIVKQVKAAIAKIILLD